MSKISLVQKEFFETLKSIQEDIVWENVNIYREGADIANLLYDVTYEAIYRVLEVIDGYGNSALKLDLVDRESNKSLRTGIELHDTCADYLNVEVVSRPNNNQ